MNFSIEFRRMQCPCGFVYFVPKDWALLREQNHKSWYCPSCKEARYYPAETEKERLECLLQQERNCCITAREEANYFEKRAQGYKGYATKLKKKFIKDEK